MKVNAPKVAEKYDERHMNRPACKLKFMANKKSFPFHRKKLSTTSIHPTSPKSNSILKAIFYLSNCRMTDVENLNTSYTNRLLSFHPIRCTSIPYYSLNSSCVPSEEVSAEISFRPLTQRQHALNMPEMNATIILFKIKLFDNG